MEARGEKQSGLTLIELMVALAIVIIVATLSTPVMNVVKSSRSTSAVQEFISSLNYARGEAVTRGQFISICRAAQDNSQQCAAAGIGNASRAWESGWIVFEDPNRDGTLNDGEDTLLIHNAIGNSYTLQTVPNDFITYNPKGFIPNTTGTWVLCDNSQKLMFARAVQLSTAGKVNNLTRDEIDTLFGVDEDTVRCTGV